MSVKTSRPIIRYSENFKLMVVQEIEQGATFMEARQRYGIGGHHTIKYWVKKFGKNHLLNKTVRIETMNEKDRLKQLEAENKMLKMKLAETFLAKDCLEELVKMANAEYKTDLKKNFGSRLPGNSEKDTQ